MPLKEESLVERVALRHSISQDAVRTILHALRSGGGAMAQFSHPEFGGMSQWSPGMTMVGDMFNNGLNSKLDAVCTELATHVAETPSTDDRDSGVSYRSKKPSLHWWPSGLGTPTAVGAQNDLEYAVFPAAQRLAIKDDGKVDIYDTGEHQIFGVGQSQSADRGLVFTSQDGLVRVSDLGKVRDS